MKILFLQNSHKVVSPALSQPATSTSRLLTEQHNIYCRSYAEYAVY